MENLNGYDIVVAASTGVADAANWFTKLPLQSRTGHGGQNRELRVKSSDFCRPRPVPRWGTTEMEQIPELRAYLLIVRLRGSAIFNQQAIERLKGALPSCSRAVLFDEHVIGIATKSEYDPVEILQHYGRELRPFENVSVLELGRLSASTYGLSEPFHFWMEGNVRGGARRESDNAEDMLKTKWGQRRREDTENRSIADTIGQVFPSTRWPRE